MSVHYSVSAVQANDILAACALNEPAPLHSLLTTLAAGPTIPCLRKVSKGGSPQTDSLEEERQELVHAIALEVLSSDGRASKQRLEQADLLRGILRQFADCSRDDRSRGEVPFYLQ